MGWTWADPNKMALLGPFIGNDLAGSSAVFSGKNKLTISPPPKGTGHWELDGMNTDPSEDNNLS